MNRKQLVAAAALAAGVAGGSIAGAMIGSPSPSSAVESIGEDDAGRPGPGERFGARFDLAVAAEAIGISEDDLRSALEEGQSIAEVAAANGVDAQVVIDALVADATARIDDAVADGDLAADRADAIKEDLTERITAAVNGEAPFDGRGGPGGPGHRFGPGLDLAAETIGISVEDLRAALADGQSLAEVATANGVEPQAVIDALVAQATERITSFVNGGDD